MNRKTLEEIGANGAEVETEEEPKRKRGRPKGSRTSKAAEEREEALNGVRKVSGMFLGGLNELFKGHYGRDLWKPAQIEIGAFHGGNLIDRYLPADRVDPDIAALLAVLVVPALPELQRILREKRNPKNAENGSSSTRENRNGKINADTGDDSTGV